MPSRCSPRSNNIVAIEALQLRQNNNKMPTTRLWNEILQCCTAGCVSL